jgi:hypothetical protein
MLVYRGRGILIALIAFVCLLAAEFYTRSRFHDDNYYQQHPWPKLVALALAALIVWWFSPQTVPAKSDPQSRPDWLVSSSLPSTPQARERSFLRVPLFRPYDSLFFIPVRFWPLLLCALGVLFYFIPSNNLP